VSGPVGRRRTANGARWRPWENPLADHPKRESLTGPLRVTARLFRDPDGSNRVGMILESPGMAAFQELMQADPSGEAARADSVRVDTAAFPAERVTVIGATEDGADFQSMNLLANAKRESPRSLQSAASMISNTLFLVAADAGL
jgi:hypothetical protein